MSWRGVKVFLVILGKVITGLLSIILLSDLLFEFLPVDYLVIYPHVL